MYLDSAQERIALLRRKATAQARHLALLRTDPDYAWEYYRVANGFTGRNYDAHRIDPDGCGVPTMVGAAPH